MVQFDENNKKIVIAIGDNLWTLENHLAGPQWAKVPKG